MTHSTCYRRFAAALTAAACVLAVRTARAQGVELSAAIGYRLGLPSYTYAPGAITDTTGGVSYGIVADVKYARDKAIEGLFSRQVTDVTITDSLGAPVRLRATVDYWHGGAIQEFGFGRVRPFLAGTLGITRYGEKGYSAARVSIGAGGGVKVMANSHIGARLDGRVYATIVSGNSSIGICGGGGCFVHVSVGAAWQADFTAAVLFAF